jgi:hypothetical protein
VPRVIPCRPEPYTANQMDPDGRVIKRTIDAIAPAVFDDSPELNESFLGQYPEAPRRLGS